jgi:hypothetical protein
MHPGHSYAVSDGEGTLLDYGCVATFELFDLVTTALMHGFTVIVGPADGTGE